MSEHLVLCGGAEQRSRYAAEPLILGLRPPKGNVKLRIEDISRKLVSDVPDLLTDLVEIAAYVYAADRSTSRGGGTLRNMGKAWYRSFHFVIPVRQPDVWGSEHVRDALVDTLSFLSDDRFEFAFEPLSDPPPLQSYLDFGAAEETGFNPDEVTLFSGGLDSFAGAVE